MAQVVDRLPPSGSERWKNCPASPTLEAEFPDDDGPEAREGQAGHFYVTEALYGRIWPVGHLAPNGHPIDADMIKFGQSYVDDVLQTIAALNIQQGEQYSYCVETHVAARSFIHPLLDGTPDTWLLLLNRKHLILWDYKYGHGYVDPYRNPQCVNYIAAILEGAGVPLADIVNWTFSVRIIQPRNYDVEASGPVRKWEPNGHVVAAEIKYMSEAAHATQLPNAPAITGDWCTHCKARLGCQSWFRVVGRAMDLAGAAALRIMTPGELGLYLKMLSTAADRIKAAQTALEAEGIAHLRKGEHVPYFRMGYVDSERKWLSSMTDAQIIAAGDMMGLDLRNKKPIKPAAAKKLAVDAAVIDALSFKPTGAAKLIASTETAAAKVFGA